MFCSKRFRRGLARVHPHLGARGKKLVAPALCALIMASSGVPASADESQSESLPTVAVKVAQESTLGALNSELQKSSSTPFVVAQSTDPAQDRIRKLEIELERMQSELKELKKQAEADRAAAAADREKAAEERRKTEEQTAGIAKDVEKVKEKKDSPLTVQGLVHLRLDDTNLEDQTDLLQDDNNVNGNRVKLRLAAKYNLEGPVDGTLSETADTLKDDFGAGIRLAVGQVPNPTVSFVRLGDSFRPNTVYVDQFYVMGQPLYDQDLKKKMEETDDPEEKKNLKTEFDRKRNLLTLAAGKMPSPFWTGTNFRNEMLWDVDVSPEGVAMNNALDLSGDNKVRLENTFGYFILNELDPLRFAGLTADTRLFADQVRLHSPIGSLGVAYYNYSNLNAGLRAPSFIPGTSTFPQTGTSAALLRPGLTRTNNQINVAPGVLAFPNDTFKMINVTGETEFAIDADSLGSPKIFLVGDYVHNTEASQDNDGISGTIGFKGGSFDKAVLNPFAVWVTYRDVDADATLSTFADSDLGAGTAYRGLEAAAKYSIRKNLAAQISHFNFEGFPRKTNRVTRTFFDLIFSF